MSGASEELIPLDLEVFRPLRLFLLYTPDQERYLAATMAGMPVLPALEPPKHILFHDQFDFAWNLGNKLPTAQDGDPRILDITLGTTLMSLCLADLAGPEDRLVYWMHRLNEDHRAIPGTQQIVSRLKKETRWVVSPSLADDQTG